MKLNRINNFAVLNNYKNNKANNAKVSGNLAYTDNTGFINLPDTKEYLNSLGFTGGYSINLAETIENMSESAYPPGIRKLAIKTVEGGNKDDKTLIDIHKEKYGKISEMETLDEVKAAFPEFKNVLSDEDIEFQPGSFIDDVKHDKLKYFDSDTDLALQLLQMYWAEGFSLNDLKEYTEGKNIFGVMEKLNIPRLNPRYGSVLKLSDKEYNERISKMMSEKQKEAAIKRAEKKDGVYIPRGPITEEHRAKIAESNRKRWAEHPELAIEQSRRMKEYYEKHPEEKEKFSQVLITAWNLKEARSIRKAMGKFLGKKDISPEEFARMNTDGNENERKDLKAFWNRNPWAKTNWSKCMINAWRVIKKREEEKNTPDCIFKIYPDAVKDNMMRWFRANGYDISKITDRNLTALYYGDKPVPEPNEYAGSAINAYVESDIRRSNLLAEIYHIASIKTITELAFDKEFQGKDHSELLQIALLLMVDKDHRGLKELDALEARNLYLRLLIQCYKKNDIKAVQRFQDNIESAYTILESSNKDIQLQKIVGRLEFLMMQNGLLSSKEVFPKFS